MTNFEKLLKNDKETIINMIAMGYCVDINNHKIINGLLCENCTFEGKKCVTKIKEWLESEVER